MKRLWKVAVLSVIFPGCISVTQTKFGNYRQLNVSIGGANYNEVRKREQVIIIVGDTLSEKLKDSIFNSILFDTTKRRFIKK